MTVDVDIWVALIGVVALLGATWLGSFLTQKTAKTTALEAAHIERVKNAQDRMWEHRREAYSNIIAKLHLLVKSADELIEGFTDGEMPPEAFYGSAYHDTLKKEATALFKASRDDFDNGRLVMSDDFSNRYIVFRSAIYETDEEDDPPTSAFAVRNAAMSAHADLLAIAKTEIAPQLPARR